MSLQIDLPPDLQRRLQQQAERERTDPSTLVVRMVERLLPPQTEALPGAEEAALLHQITLGVPAPTWERYHFLTERRRNETLTEQEREELIQISDQIEAANAQRIEDLATLAQLRGTTVRALMTELGIPPGSYV